MQYILLILGAGVLHLLIERLADEKVTAYLTQTQLLLYAKRYTDGCSSPFKTFIHRWLDKSHDLCAAHDYGNLGYIKNIRPGWHNNWVTWLAHMSQTNPVYWVWGTVISIFTLPWSIWRRNLDITFLDVGPFHGILFLIAAIPSGIYYSINYQ